MAKVHWLIEKELWEPEVEAALIAAAGNLGQKTTLISFDGTKITREFDALKTLVPYGCINFGRWFDRNLDGLCYYNSKNLRYSAYSAHWGQYLLNKDFFILPYGELKRRGSSLCETFSSHYVAPCSFFVRPNENDKSFTGRVLYVDTFDQEVEKLGFSTPQQFGDEMLVVIAPQKSIGDEWRFVISRGKVVTCSKYNTCGMSNVEAGCSNRSAFDLAIKIAAHGWQPDVMYTLDIGLDLEDLHRPKVVEIGAFNTSGLYGCDMEKIVREIEELAAIKESE